MKSYFTMWACCVALVQAALPGEAGTAMIEQRAQSFTKGGATADPLGNGDQRSSNKGRYP